MLPSIIKKSKYLSDKQRSIIYDEKIREFPLNERIFFVSKFSSLRISQCYTENSDNFMPIASSELKKMVDEVVTKAHVTLMVKSTTITIEELVFLKHNLTTDLIRYYPKLSINEVINAFEMGSRGKLPNCKTIFSLTNFHEWLDAYIDISRPIINRISNAVDLEIDNNELKMIGNSLDSAEVEFEKTAIITLEKLEGEFLKNGKIDYNDIGNVIFHLLFKKKIIINISTKDYHKLYVESIDERILEIEEDNKKFIRNEMRFRIIDTTVVKQSILDKTSSKEVNLIYITFYKKALNHFLNTTFSDQLSDEYIRLNTFMVS